jgi:putative sterol carrier protein
MHVFHSEHHFYDVMRDVFDQVCADPQKTHAITRSNLVMRIKTTHPDAEILVDGRQPPMEIFYGHRPGRADIEITLAGNLLHDIWLSKASSREAFFSGKIKTHGNMLKMMKLTDLFYECERVYPDVVRKYGLPK